MDKQSSVSSALDDRPVEVVGQVRGVQMHPLGKGSQGYVDTQFSYEPQSTNPLSLDGRGLG